MLWIIYILNYILLMYVIRKIPKEKEKNFWLKVTFLYLVSIITLNINILPIPIGLIIAFSVVDKEKTINKSIKKIVLLFGLVYFILTIVVPPIEIKDILTYNELHKEISRFEDVHSIHIYDDTAPIQKEIRKYYDSDSSLYLQFITWVLNQRGIEIVNKEWLEEAYSRDNLNFYWSSIQIDGLTRHVYIRFKDGSGEYFGIFKKENDGSRYYLKTVIEHSGIEDGIYPTIFP
ncbi:hypothetical protein BHF71_10030 [Vulcanibacillus modesticaldus]|uniref:Uncharacterized protein n=1 Tax=Vulcanibacillus modesticaldus TaxID=337097 RepID=A0A1D2YU31_9BACI|nr:hypothetical protein [Vulcanibacillus modesticaldus]OEF99163.1 hypothetical protein BHF71_10030 [Vulcanibacillus modesticaldus]